MRIVKFSLGLFFLFTLVSCGTTVISLETKGTGYSIYSNGKFIGTDKAYITRNGWPKGITLTVKDNKGKEIANQFAKRRITFGTILFSIIPYPNYFSIIFNWKFERNINVLIPTEQGDKSSWDEDEKKSPWD